MIYRKDRSISLFSREEKLLRLSFLLSQNWCMCYSAGWKIKCAVLRELYA